MAAMLYSIWASGFTGLLGSGWTSEEIRSFSPLPRSREVTATGPTACNNAESKNSKHDVDGFQLLTEPNSLCVHASLVMQVQSAVLCICLFATLYLSETANVKYHAGLL